MIIEKIKEDLKRALKDRETLRVSVLRFLLAQIYNREIEKGKGLSEEEILAVIQKQAKERREAISAFKAGGRRDLVEKEEKELEILNSYLPKQISDEELTSLVEGIIGEMGAGPQDLGKVMKEAMVKVGGRAEGARVAEAVKKILNPKS